MRTSKSTKKTASRKPALQVEPAPGKKLLITDVVLRDGHQSLLATRMRTEDMLPVAEKLDRVGYWSVEVWGGATFDRPVTHPRSEEHTSELQSQSNLVCRLLLEKKKINTYLTTILFHPMDATALH